MGNNYSLVINNTTENITIKERKETYCTGLNEPVRYSSKEGKNLGPGEHARFCPKDLKKRWKQRVKLMDTSTVMLVSLKGGEKSNKVVVLSIDEFERNIAIVINIGEIHQLVKELVSRDEAKSFEKHEDQIEELKEHLVSIVVRLSPLCLPVSIFIVFLRGLDTRFLLLPPQIQLQFSRDSSLPLALSCVVQTFLSKFKQAVDMECNDSNK
ncbi:hypothetical protein ACH5RR_016097 [Cinchona calisaya]|uniref:Uncharacterized protein n=1 Tax=Cinchona calisaya TaxID=153742 RepID=A0ABD2ZYE1_9GENT